MRLVKAGENLVAGLEACDARANALNDASAVGSRNYAICDGEWVFTLRISGLDIWILEYKRWEITFGMARSR